jgi:hypothetical protein
VNHCINCGVELEGCDHDPNGDAALKLFYPEYF